MGLEWWLRRNAIKRTAMLALMVAFPSWVHRAFDLALTPR
jgi:hypothetical protein